MAELVIGEYVNVNFSSWSLCEAGLTQTIISYILERKLKAGSAAEVHLGCHSKTKQAVAVKIFTSKACPRDPELASLVAAEIEAAKVTEVISTKSSLNFLLGSQTQTHR